MTKEVRSTKPVRIARLRHTFSSLPIIFLKVFIFPILVMALKPLHDYFGAKIRKISVKAEKKY